MSSKERKRKLLNKAETPPTSDTREEYFGFHPRLARKIGTLALVLSISSTINGVAEQYAGDSDSVFFQSPLCETFVPHEDVAGAEQELAAAVESKAKDDGSGSSIGEFDSPWRLAPAERLNQIFDFLENEQYEFTMEKSGVSVSIYSNGESPLTPTEFTQLYEFPLQHHDEYPLAEMRHQMACYNELLTEEKVAADVPVWVFISDKNQPNTCLSWGMMVNFDSEEERRKICDHSGVSFPIRIKFLNQTVFEAYAIVITPNTASTDPTVIAERLRSVTLHEATPSGHLGDYQTSTPTPLDMNEESVKLRTDYTQQLYKRHNP